ncbi:Protocadherin-1 [Taenia solium]|eukprot:TsM_000895600 transcript=TsM_000895600 gene=TsM_000895600
MAAVDRAIICLLIFLLRPIRCQRRFSAQFSLGDNTEGGHRVGNLFTNRPNNLPYGQGFHSAMIKPDDHFGLTINGDLVTSHAVDRDVICSKLDCCDRPICYMHAEAYFFTTRPHPIVFNVTVTISDENDNPPKFDVPQDNLVKLPSWIPDQYRALPFLQLSVPESAGINSNLSLPLASDPDSTDFGINSYELQPLYVNTTSSVSPFRLVHERSRHGAETLTLIAGRSLDREEQDNYWFLLIALGSGSPSLSGSLLLQIQVDDINDHAPIFQQPSSKSGHTIELPENTPIGKVVYSFRATDQDVGDNGKLTFSINHGASLPRTSALVNKWVLDPITGDLSVAGVLDYENKEDRKFVLSLLAKDSGNPSLTATTSFTILITDLNDNPPAIEVKSTGESGDDKRHFDIEENDGEVRLLKLISVSDPDSNPEESVSCYLSENRNDFALQKYSPLLYGLFNSRTFDFEKNADAEGHLSVGVSCTDNGTPSLTSDLTVLVSLRDLNDNYPQFEYLTFTFNVHEDIPIGSEIGRIVARDADSGLRGKLSYWLNADDPDDLNLVEIDRETGRITSKFTLDREQKEILNFRVTVADGGSQDIHQGFEEIPSDAKTNTTTIRICLLDVNDNAPHYMGEKEIHVRENNEEGFAVLDSLPFQDNDLGENGTVRLFLTDYDYDAVEYLMSSHSNGMFSLLNGKQLILTESVDREQNPHIFVRIIAIDGGRARQLTSTTTLTVIVDDENDNYPQLTHPLNATMLSGPINHYETIDDQASRTIPVDTPFGSLITTLRSRDLDSGDNGRVFYHLKRAEPHELWFPTHQSHVGHGMENSLQKHKLILDGNRYFKIDEVDGHLRTAWLYGGQNDHVSSNATGIPPSPSFGVHVIVVELRDAGNPSLATRVVLYANVTEAVNSGFFGLLGLGLGEAGLGNTVILILIIVCSFALIISLTAAIFWVRLRVYTTNGQPNQANGVKYQTGCVSAYQDDLPRGPRDGGLGYLDSTGTFKPLEGIRWSTPNVLDPLRYMVHTAPDIGAESNGGSLAFIGKSRNGYLGAEEVQMLPMIHPTEAESMMTRGYDQLIVGNAEQYELCFPETVPANFVQLQAGSTESDSGLDSGGYMIGNASSPSPEGATEHPLGPTSDMSITSTFKPSHCLTYVPSTAGCSKITADVIRQSPGKQILFGTTCSTVDLSGFCKSLDCIPRDSVSPLDTCIPNQKTISFNLPC